MTPVGKDSSYTFDFDAEVARARRDFPQETADVIFINLADRDAREKVEALFFRQEKFRLAERIGLPPEAALRERPGDALVAVRAQALAEYHIAASSCSYPVMGKPPVRVLQLMVPPAENLMGTSPDHEAFFLFAHELGHLVVPDALAPGPKGGEKLHANEVKADSFAVLYGLKNSVFGQTDVRRLSFDRLWRGVFGDARHLTSEALDHIVAARNDFTALTLPAILDSACKAGERFAKPLPKLESLSLEFLRVCRKTPGIADSLTAGVRSLQKGKTFHDMVKANKRLCDAIEGHYTSVKYKLGLCGDLKKDVAKKLLTALRQ